MDLAHAIVIILVLLYKSHVDASTNVRNPPSIPLHFEADLEITAHLLDTTVAYPPALPRADILAGYEMGKSYLRRYDLKKEFKVKYGKYQNCERAYLGEEMPKPDLPQNLEFLGLTRVYNDECEVWVQRIPDTTLRNVIYKSIQLDAPIRLTQESFDEDSKWNSIITYDLRNLKIQPQEISFFNIPGGYSIETCTRSVTGFPYIHIFDHYIRF